MCFLFSLGCPPLTQVLAPCSLSAALGAPLWSTADPVLADSRSLRREVCV